MFDHIFTSTAKCPKGLWQSETSNKSLLSELGTL